jgi:hypothetical protein
MCVRQASAGVQSFARMRLQKFFQEAFQSGVCCPPSIKCIAKMPFKKFFLEFSAMLNGAQT